MKIPKHYSESSLSTVPELQGVDITRSMYFHGGVGSGKTYALYSIIRKRKESCLPVCVYSFETLIRRIRGTFDGPVYVETEDGGYYETEKKIIDRLSRTPWLGIDDLGGIREDAPASRFVLGCVYEIINNRYDEELPTVITSNRTPAALAKEFDVRVSSRIVGMSQVVEFKNTDRRLRGQ